MIFVIVFGGFCVFVLLWDEKALGVLLSQPVSRMCSATTYKDRATLDHEDKKKENGYSDG